MSACAAACSFGTTLSQSLILFSVYRGWEIDPITLEYKYMIFTDGDDCDDSGNSYQFELELVRKTPKAPVHVFGFKEVEPCVYTAKLAAHLPPQELYAQEGIHSPGVIDISPAQETLPKVCGEMQCKYDTVTNRLLAISNQVRQNTYDVSICALSSCCLVILCRSRRSTRRFTRLQLQTRRILRTLRSRPRQ